MLAHRVVSCATRGIHRGAQLLAGERHRTIVETDRPVQLARAPLSGALCVFIDHSTARLALLLVSIRTKLFIVLARD
jgi:hypothetical protein